MRVSERVGERHRERHRDKGRDQRKRDSEAAIRQTLRERSEKEGQRDRHAQQATCKGTLIERGIRETSFLTGRESLTLVCLPCPLPQVGC